ncbi:Calcitonin gene-related peptide type 1 receptor [Lamellibrachia satsuma]|nr:Calcitonin gene-related peptide type 1 receptor [Lamellibrachia satsuma]
MNPARLGPNMFFRGRAVKRCTLNGTWYGKDGQAWTDYTACLDRESYMVGVYICMACSGMSICLLAPAVVIFFVFRDLYKQHRVRLHINFFLALALQGVASIMWYGMVHYDLFVHTTSTNTVLHRNPLWCRLLSFFKIYFASATYFWMFCEGYFLHRLISKAFEPPKTLVWLYLFGWGIPLLPSVVYAILRGTIANDSCWAISVGDYEWIVYAPNLFCLVVNLLFLSNILRILLFQLHSHPHEPSNFRRGLKAAFMLIPLFGLQLFLTIYRPPSGSTGQKEYEYVTFLVTCSQGIFVALIFCFFNGEVLSHFRDVFPCLRRSRRDHCHSTTQMTQMSMTMVDDGRSPQLSPKKQRAARQDVNIEMRPLANNDQCSKNKTNGSSTKEGYRQVPIIVEDGDVL